MLVSGGGVCLTLSFCLGRRRSDRDWPRRAAQWVSAAAFFLFLLFFLECLLAVRFPPAYLPSQSSVEPLAVRDPYLGFTLNPKYADAYKINSQGFRGAEFAPVKSGYRVVCVGDSIVFGFELNDESAPFPVQLQDKLRAAGYPDIEVINGGVPGYSSLNVLRFVERKVLPLAPDLIIVTTGWNDLIPSLAPGWRPDSPETGVEPPRDYSPLAIMRAARTLGARLRGRVQTGRHHATAAPGAEKIRPEALNPAAVEQYRSNLLKLAGLCRDRGVSLILMNIPSVLSRAPMSASELAKAGPFTPEVVGVYEDVAADVCRQVNGCYLKFFNLEESGKDPFFWDHCHLTVAGCAEAARRLEPLVRERMGQASGIGN
jgi:lysophospholipase L1-like esterase